MESSTITNWSESAFSELKRVRAVALDIDETLSTRGKLTAQAYQALWSLKQAGFTVVPITGRPAGWCDLIARFWPVDAVVGENGAFTFFMQQGVRKRIDTPSGIEPERAQAQLRDLGEKIRARFPGVRWASDQSYREFDLAVDFCEDVPPWERKEVDALVALCEAEGAHAKVSSIHVNTWFGDYDKKGGFSHWIAKGAPGLAGPAPSLDEWIFVGDSPNDEPMFRFFPKSVGVANLATFRDRLKHPPTWITAAESGAGFVEMADRLIRSRCQS